MREEADTIMIEGVGCSRVCPLDPTTGKRLILSGAACLTISTFDDPGVICAMLPWSYFLTEYQHKGVRWSMCAKEICFSNWFLRSARFPPSRLRGIGWQRRNSLQRMSCDN